MKCLNQQCSSLRAIEVNISINTSDCWTGEQPDYTGDTEYGPCSPAIGTFCYDCKETFLYENALEVAAKHLQRNLLSKTQMAG